MPEGHPGHRPEPREGGGGTPPPTGWVGRSGRELIFAAAVATLRDGRSQSFFDPFVPFVAEALREASGTALSVEEVQRLVEERFGLPIPQGALRSVLKRAGSRFGLVERRNHRFVPRPEALDRLSMRPLQERFFTHHRTVVRDLCRFAEERYGIEIDEATAEDELLAFVGETAALLALHERVEALGVSALKGGEPVLEYVIAAYVNHIREHDEEAFGYLETVVQGVMWQAYLYVDDLGSVQRKFSDSTVFFLDTQVLLRARGFEGPELEAATRELLKLCKLSNARVACFDITVDEAARLLRGIAATIHSGARPERMAEAPSVIEQHFLEQAVTPSRIESYAEALEDDLRSRGIEVVSCPLDRGADGDPARARLREAFGDYKHERARAHDADVLIAVNRRRGGSRPRFWEDCRAMFVTTNERHVEVAGDQFQLAGDEGRWPLAVLDDHLSFLLWLKQPLDAPDLPRLRIAADCYGALRPTPRWWEQFLAALARLRTSGDLRHDDYQRLRFSLAARETLMDRTQGDPERITDETVVELLEIARARRPDHVEVEVAIQELAREQSEQLRAGMGELRGEIGAVVNELPDMVQDRVEAELRKRELEVRRRRRRRRVRRSVYGAFTLVATVLIVAPLGAFLVRPEAGVLVAGTEAATLSVARSIWGRLFSVRRLFRQVERCLLRRLDDRAVREHARDVSPAR